MGIAEADYRQAFAALVTDLAGNNKMLLIEFDGAMWLANLTVDDAQVAQSLPFPWRTESPPCK